MIRSKWTDRKFTFDFPEGWMNNILERLRGTPIRLNTMTFKMSEAAAEVKPENRWSIKENIGHLSDLEDLHEARIDDFLAGLSDLRPADMTNARTHGANHNARTIQELLAEFAQKRVQFISRLEKLDDQTLLRKAMHPRLKVLMRPVDVAFFTAEHDDHHLADMRQVILQFPDIGSAR